MNRGLWQALKWRQITHLEYAIASGLALEAGPPDFVAVINASNLASIIGATPRAVRAALVRLRAKGYLDYETRHEQMYVVRVTELTLGREPSHKAVTSGQPKVHGSVKLDPSPEPSFTASTGDVSATSCTTSQLDQVQAVVARIEQEPARDKEKVFGELRTETRDRYKDKNKGLGVADAPIGVRVGKEPRTTKNVSLDVERVWAVFLNCTRSAAKLSTWASKVAARLKTFRPEEIERAIRLTAGSAWWREHPDRLRDPEQFFGSDQRLDRKLASGGGGNGGAPPSEAAQPVAKFCQCQTGHGRFMMRHQVTLKDVCCVCLKLWPQEAPETKQAVDGP